MILKFYSGSDTAMLCAKFQNDSIIEMDHMVERVFMKFEFKMNFGQIFYIAQPPSQPLLCLPVFS